MRVYIEGVGLRGPGLDGWAASAPILSVIEGYVAMPTRLPPATLLPANERRRAVQTVKIALAVGEEALSAAHREPTATVTVFASSGADGDTINDILTVLASADRAVSPTRFHNSVHNTPAGYWSIATGSTAASTSLCCYDDSFAAGLLEAAVQVCVDGDAVVLIAYDTPYPSPLHEKRPLGAVFGVALVLTPAPTSSVFASIDLEVDTGSSAASIGATLELEALRNSTPAARSLPLLSALAGRNATRVRIDYLGDMTLSLNVIPIQQRGGYGRLDGGSSDMTILDRREIADMIPHAASMCLLDSVLSWDASSLRCLSRCHRLFENPMRRADGTLGVACGIELAAQAMAVHGRVASGDAGPPIRGALASVRDIYLRTQTLDETQGDLIVDAHLLMGDSQGATYQFVITSNDVELMSGRATVLFGIDL